MADDVRAGPPAGVPARAGLVLATLIVVAAVANLNLAVANVALPSVERDFVASQTSLDLVGVGFSLGLAASVLYLGAIGDRYGRKQVLVIGMALTVPACIVAATAPSVEVLAVGRVLGGVAAGMAYPTTLALVTALWSAEARTRPIALWSGIGGGVSALGPMVAGFLLLQLSWRWVFLITLPLAIVGGVLALRLVPSHVHETTEPVDHVGGVLSAIAVAALVLAINLAAAPGGSTTALFLAVVAAAGAAAFVVRQRRVRVPLYDLHLAARRTFWVAAVAGIIVFGSLMGAMFVGQQFLQDVLGYSTLSAGVAVLPVAVLMVLMAPVSARMVERHGSRTTLLVGFGFCLASFTVMLVLWQTSTPYWQVALAYACIGVGVGLAGTPASRALTGSVPVRRVGMASGTADLQRDLGGAIMQSVLGALLTAGYAVQAGSALAAAPAADQQAVGETVRNELQRSFTGAADVAQQFPAYKTAIIESAKASFLSGANWAFAAAIGAVVVGGVVVAVWFPGREGEDELLARYRAEDGA
ncbi:MAG: MFS transporter [Acidimicrobiales bacterium]